MKVGETYKSKNTGSKWTIVDIESVCLVSLKILNSDNIPQWYEKNDLPDIFTHIADDVYKQNDALWVIVQEMTTQEIYFKRTLNDDVYSLPEVTFSTWFERIPE